MLRKSITWVTSVLVSALLIFASLSVFGLVLFRVVLSGSMEPAISKGDLVVGLSWVRPNSGDIAIYQQRDLNGLIRQDVVHRVIKIDQNNELTFKGDNNKSQDALPVKPADVKGTVVYVVPSLGSLLLGIGIAPLLLICFGVAAISFGIYKLIR